MNARELESYHIYRKVQAFLDQWATLFLALNASPLRKAFDALVDQLAGFVASQEHHQQRVRGRSNHVEVLRTRLIEDHIDPIIAMATILESKLPQIKLKAPKTDQHPVGLCVSAHGLANDIEGVASEFAALGLPPNFVEELRGAAWALDVAVTKHGSVTSMGVGVTSGVADTVKKANDHLRAIATLVRKEIRDRPDLVAEWENVRRLPTHRSRGIRAPRRPALPTASTPLLSAPERASAPRALLPAASADGVEVATADAEEMSSTDGAQARPRRRLWATARHLLGAG